MTDIRLVYEHQRYTVETKKYKLGDIAVAWGVNKENFRWFILIHKLVKFRNI